jgi:hypothetical protein
VAVGAGLMAGFVRDAFMAIYITMVIETDGVGSMYAGTATGLTLAISGIGNFIAPPLGNSLAVLWPGAPIEREGLHSLDMCRADEWGSLAILLIY